MSGKVSRLILVAIPLAVMGILFAGIPSAWAQTPSPENDASCISCHENLYVLRDTGKWYCLCGTKAHCTYCHGGVAGTLDEKAAHQGLINNPLTDNAAACQKCHPEDYQEHVAMFVAHGGIRPTPIVLPTYDVALASVGTAATTELLRPQPIEAWKLAGLSALGVGFVFVIIFAIRCYKEDCIRNKFLQ